MAGVPVTVSYFCFHLGIAAFRAMKSLFIKIEEVSETVLGFLITK